MFFIESKLRDSIDYDDVQQSISKSIAKQTDRLLDHIRFGMKSCINYNDLESLIDYRDILQTKLKCDLCLLNYSKEFIVSKIFQIINRN